MRAQTPIVLSALSLVLCASASYYDDGVFDIYARHALDDLDLYERDLDADVDFLEARDAGADFDDGFEYIYTREAVLQAPQGHINKAEGCARKVGGVCVAHAFGQLSGEYPHEGFPLKRQPVVRRSFYDEDEVLDMLYSRWALPVPLDPVAPGSQHSGTLKPAEGLSGGIKGGRKGKGNKNKKCTVFVNGKCQQHQGEPPVAGSPTPGDSGTSTDPNAPATTTHTNGFTVVNQ
ncbi:MAG: hypothetical protein LQ340_002617 [Diploschistes diacapsis]|nr:MAG: hypothetical protein LQ340_002617 [Diploschistes diacapsis]